jgi:adenosylcobyric acid synthase
MAAARILVAGTTSDAGKSVVATGLCRAFARRGVAVAPFKAQNMSNNSMVCAGPGEIGRAQWIQAVAARATPEVAMNPVLLKPGGDRRSHVVVMGQPAGELGAQDFVGGRGHLQRAAHAAFDDLAERFDLIVAEGAGSPAEINLRSDDYVNMGLAQHAHMATVLVGDIDRGGVFAAFYGTLALLDAADQRLIAGFVINKFRGDERLLEPGLRDLHRLTGRPALGVLPWHPDLWLDSEDALDLEGRRSSAGTGTLRVAVVRLPRISNVTDVDALGIEPDVDVTFASEPRDLAGVDLVVLPGTRATIADLAWLREQGLDRAIERHAAAGQSVLGICGGLQMLGTSVVDPHGVEGPSGTTVAGLGLLDVTTVFGRDKVLGLPSGEALGERASGYEIHHGRVLVGDAAEDFLGGARDGAVRGTMWHGSLECDRFRRALLQDVARVSGRAWAPSSARFAAARERRLDLLGDLVERHLDLDALLDLATHGVPALAVIGPAGRTDGGTPTAPIGGSVRRP